jgi:hypothetical protein
MLIDRRLQQSIGFSTHALQRFVERAAITAQTRRDVEAVLRDLLYQEGRFVRERPHWARSRKGADAYIQVGEWLLLICRHDETRLGAFTVVTIVNGPQGNNWLRAFEMGYIATPPPQSFPWPQKPHVSFWSSVEIAKQDDRPDRPGLLSRVIETHRARRARARVTYEAAVNNRRDGLAAYETRRRQARESYRRRYGS